MATGQIPHLFELSPHLSDFVNRHIVQSEIEGGVHLQEIPPGTVLTVYIPAPPLTTPRLAVRLAAPDVETISV